MGSREILIQYYEKFREHRYVDPMDVGGFGVKKVNFMKYEKYIYGVKGKLYNKNWSRYIIFLPRTQLAKSPAGGMVDSYVYHMVLSS